MGFTVITMLLLKKGVDKLTELRMRVDNIVDDYLQRGDSSNENANMGFGANGLLFAVGAEGLSKDNLRRLENEGHREIAELHKRGCVHIHDLGLGFAAPYCAGWSLANLLDGGIKAGSIVSAPAKHFRTAINHIVNFIGAASNEFAGAQAFSDIDIYLAPYAFKSYLDYKAKGINDNVSFKLAKREVSQSIQELLFHLNYNTRWGGQTPFSNITLAITCPPDMRDRVAMVAGKPLSDYYEFSECGFSIQKNITYGELYTWQSMVVEAILDTFLHGDSNGNGFTFPILTINVTEEFFSLPIRHKIFELSAKFGTPYFQNFVNGHSGGQRINPADVRSMCCRLQLNEADIRKHTGGLFGHAEQTGSLQVITLSLPWIAESVRDVDCFFKVLDETMELCRNEMLWKRKTVEEFFNRGFFPTAKANLQRGFKTFFTTIGFVGLWEAVEILTEADDSFLNEEGMVLAEQILTYMKDKVDCFTRETGHLFNLEATPAESACYKLAQKALKEFPDIRHRGLKKAPYFTNSCHIPVELQDALDLMIMTQNRLQTIPNGGTVTHFYIGDEVTADQIEVFVKTICDTKIPYFSTTVVYSICPICGRIAGAHAECPKQHTEEQIKQLEQERPDLVTE